MDTDIDNPTQESENSHKIVEDAYNTIAPTYHEVVSMHPTDTRVRYIQELAMSLQPGSKVLELGCGGGLGSRPFVERGCELTAVDISEAQIALARDIIPSATLLHSNMLSVDFPPSSFDAIVAMYTIMHLKKEEQEVMIGRISRWLKTGGQLLCNLPGSEEAEIIHGKWLGARMFFESLGVEGNTRLFHEHGKGLRIVRDEVVVDTYDAITSEMVGEPDETFHWIRAVKEDMAVSDVAVQ